MNQSLSIEQLTYIESRLANEKKSIGLSYLLWFFLGLFGAHNFYIGRTTVGVFQLILTVFGIATSFVGVGAFMLGIVGIWAIVDAFLIPGAISADLDRKRQIMIAGASAGV